MLRSRHWFLSGRRCNYIVPVVSDDMICTYSVACRCSAFRLLRMCLRNICIPFCYPLIWNTKVGYRFENSFSKDLRVQNTKSDCSSRFCFTCERKICAENSVLIIELKSSPNLKHYRKYPYNQLIIRIFVILCELLSGEIGIRTRLRYISESQILSILSSLAGNDLETKRSFFVRTCLKEPLLHCKYKYSFLFTQIILIFLYTKVFDWLLFGGSCLI